MILRIAFIILFLCLATSEPIKTFLIDQGHDRDLIAAPLEERGWYEFASAVHPVESIALYWRSEGLLALRIPENAYFNKFRTVQMFWGDKLLQKLRQRDPKGVKNNNVQHDKHLFSPLHEWMPRTYLLPLEQGLFENDFVRTYSAAHASETPELAKQSRKYLPNPLQPTIDGTENIWCLKNTRRPAQSTASSLRLCSADLQVLMKEIHNVEKNDMRLQSIDIRTPYDYQPLLGVKQIELRHKLSFQPSGTPTPYVLRFYVLVTDVAALQVYLFDDVIVMQDGVVAHSAREEPSNITAIPLPGQPQEMAPASVANPLPTRSEHGVATLQTFLRRLEETNAATNSVERWTNEWVPKMELIMKELLSLMEDKAWNRARSFEIVAFDFVFDASLQLWFVDAIENPLTGNTTADDTLEVTEAKRAMMRDLFKIVFNEDCHECRWRLLQGLTPEQKQAKEAEKEAKRVAFDEYVKEDLRRYSEEQRKKKEVEEQERKAKLLSKRHNRDKKLPL